MTPLTISARQIIANIEHQIAYWRDFDLMDTPIARADADATVGGIAALIVRARLDAWTLALEMVSRDLPYVEEDAVELAIESGAVSRTLVAA